jgi:hypothetical protein
MKKQNSKQVVAFLQSQQASSTIPLWPGSSSATVPLRKKTLASKQALYSRHPALPPPHPFALQFIKNLFSCNLY